MFAMFAVTARKPPVSAIQHFKVKNRWKHFDVTRNAQP